MKKEILTYLLGVILVVTIKKLYNSYSLDHAQKQAEVQARERTKVSNFPGLESNRSYISEHEKEAMLSSLENFRLSHLAYPTALNELKIDISKDFYYSPDSFRQSYLLFFSQGIDTIVYNSTTKIWRK